LSDELTKAIDEVSQKLDEVADDYTQTGERLDDIEKNLLKKEDVLEGIDEKIKTAVGESVDAVLAERGIEFEVGENLAAKKPYASFGEQLMDVVKAANNDGDAIARLMEVKATGLSEGVAADGGFLVQTDYSNELLKKIHDTGVLAAKCRKITISSNSNGVKIPYIAESSRADGSRWGGVLAYWLNEAGSKTPSDPEFGKLELSLKKLIGLCYATDELLQDAAALESIISQAFSEEFGFKIDDAIINGTGAGQPLGILNAACLVTVAKEVGQPNTTIVYDNVLKMWSRMWAKSRANAVWLINQDIEPQLNKMNMAVGTGGVPVWLPAGGATATPYSTLFGRPVIPVEQCQTLGTKGDIYLADFSQYIIAEKGGMQTASSIHVKFTYDETCFRFVYRIDGRPWWAAALIPYTGAANTQSPFITLAGRP